MADMARWESKQIDYVQAFSQAPIYSDVYLHLTGGFHVDGEDKNLTYFLRLKNNLDVTNQAKEIWFDMLKTRLEDAVFKQKKVDQFIFVKKLYRDLLIW